MSSSREILNHLRASPSIDRMLKSNHLIWLIIAFGAFLRILQYARNRSLWVDECSLALNIISRSFSQLLDPLDYNQAAPIGFLMVQRLMVGWLGDSEYTLRLIPFIAGLGSLIFFYKMAKQFMDRGAVMIAVSLFAISIELIYYSSEMKQYSLDVFFTILFCWLTLKAQATNFSSRTLFVLAVLGFCAMWFSHPACFMAASAALTLTFICFQSKNWNLMAKLAGIYCLWIVCFLSLYSLSLKSLGQNAHLLEYWKGAFMPLPPRSVKDINWFLETPFNIFKYPFGLALPGLAILASLAGIMALFYRIKEMALILLLPIILSLLASGFYKYPFAGRLILFISPLVLILVAEGIWMIREKTRSVLPWLWIAILFLLFLNPTISASHSLIRPQTREEIRPVLEYLARYEKRGDIIYIYHGAITAVRYYSNHIPLRSSTVEGIFSRNWVDYEREIDKLCGNQRVWVLFSHVLPCDWRNLGLDEERFFLNLLDRIGSRRDSLLKPGASVYLYELTPDCGGRIAFQGSDAQEWNRCY